MDPDPYLDFLTYSPVLTLLLVFLAEWSSIILLLLLLISLGLFTAIQSAILSVKLDDPDSPESINSRSKNALAYLKNHPKQFTSLVLACNTVVVIAICITTNSCIQKWLPSSVFNQWSEHLLRLFSDPTEMYSSIDGPLTFLFVVFCATTLILLFREWMPNFFEWIPSKKMSLLFAIPMKLLYWLFFPLTHTMVSLAEKAEIVILKHKLSLQSTTKQDLDTAIDLALTNEKSNEKQVNILRGIINFNDVSSKQVMTPRTEIYGLEIQMPYNEVLQIVKECGFSRLPVYQEDFDQISGILYAKDLIAHLQENAQFEWQRLIRTNVLFVPESKKINELLDTFREHHKHMAFVVDEYGGTNGLITLEDIMEQIVGEIKDEFDDQQERNYIKLDANNYLFEGKTLINDLCRILSLDVESFDKARGNADSIAGLFLEHSGEMPYKDQVLEINDLRFTVTSVSKKRIEQIKVSL